jgi:hypothetical protein
MLGLDRKLFGAGITFKNNPHAGPSLFSSFTFCAIPNGGPRAMQNPGIRRSWFLNRRRIDICSGSPFIMACPRRFAARPV